MMVSIQGASVEHTGNPGEIKPVRAGQETDRLRS